jgi:PAS domain S-box-containing protein
LTTDDRFTEILGYRPGEIEPRGASWVGLIHPEDLPRFRQAIKDQLAGLSAFLDIEHRVRCWYGDWKWLLSRGKVVERDTSGRAVRMVGTILDVTEHKQNQERVRSLTRALIERQERERQVLALDLHDEVVQQLAAFTLFLEGVRQDNHLRSVRRGNRSRGYPAWLGSNLTPNDAYLRRSGNDLVLRIVDTTDILPVKDFFKNDSTLNRVEQIQFMDGTSGFAPWVAADSQPAGNTAVMVS